MNSYCYKFYPSILDCFQHYLDADKEFEDAFNIDTDGNYKVSLDDITEARLQELLDRINRVPREPIPAADKGTCFNMLVDIVAANPIALVRQGDQYDCYSMEMNGAEYRYSRQLIDKLGEWYRGCPSQVYTAAPIETAYGRVLLYGYIDEIREGKVCDLKTTSRYSFGKYEHYWQRYLYPYCLQRNNLMKPEAFVFDVIQWRELKGQPLDGVRYQEEYTYLHDVAEEKLRGICERFAEFLELHRSEITDRKIFGEEA